MKQAIKKWYEGEYVPFKNDPNSGVVFINAGHFERHWTARFIRWAIDFYMREWKWVLGALAAIFSLVFLGKV